MIFIGFFVFTFVIALIDLVVSKSMDPGSNFNDVVVLKRS